MQKRLIPLFQGFLALILCLSLFNGVVTPVEANPGFAGGEGTIVDPYQIATAEQLDKMRDHLDAHFKLVADINLGVVPWNEEGGWVPIGSLAIGQRFRGSLDGNGYVISNLTVNRSDTNYQGLFGYLDGAELRDLHLIGASVVGSSFTGGLAGRANNSWLVGIKVSGNVTGLTETGGLVGMLDGGYLGQSESDVEVSGTTSSGGLVGFVTGTSHINQNTGLGSVEGTFQVGGLVGWLGVGTLTDSYAQTSVVGTNNVGGLVGRAGSSINEKSHIYRS